MTGLFNKKNGAVLVQDEPDFVVPVVDEKPAARVEKKLESTSSSIEVEIITPCKVNNKNKRAGENVILDSVSANFLISQGAARKL